MVMEQTQKLDDITRTLGIIIESRLNDARHKMEIVAQMPNVLTNKLSTLARGIEHSGQMLESLSYKNVLNRGYAIARDKNGIIISTIQKAEDIATIEFSDGIAKI